MADNLNDKYVRKDVFDIVVKHIDEELGEIKETLHEIKNNSKNSLNLKTILIIVAIATGGAGTGFAGIIKLLEHLPK